MDDIIKEITENKILLYSTIGVLSFIFIVFSVDSYNSFNYVEEDLSFNNFQVNEFENYIGLVKLGLAPSAPSREVTTSDVDTGIKLRAGDNIYSLIESHTWVTKDYGKTFVVRIA